MKQYWQRIAIRVDALTLRERVVVFALIALVLIMIANAMLLDPLFGRIKKMSGEIKENQAKIAELQGKVQAAVRQQTTDPDADAKSRLAKLAEQSKHIQSSLQEVQKGLVTPDKMSSLLESILRRHGNLRLVSLKTLPPASLTGAGETNNKTATGKEPAGKGTIAAVLGNQPAEGKTSLGYVYKHGVEITLQGSYLDMVSYMTELEAMPWQVFWGKAVLNAEEFSRSTLTLTLYTLSLDKEWLNI